MRTAVGERSHRQVGSVSAAGSNERKRNNAKEEGYGEARISYQCRLVGYVNRGKRQGGWVLWVQRHASDLGVNPRT